MESQNCYWITVNYREAYNIYDFSTLFNHESPVKEKRLLQEK